MNNSLFRIFIPTISIIYFIVFFEMFGTIIYIPIIFISHFFNFWTRFIFFPRHIFTGFTPAIISICGSFILWKMFCAFFYSTFSATFCIYNIIHTSKDIANIPSRQQVSTKIFRHSYRHQYRTNFEILATSTQISFCQVSKSRM